MLKKAFYLFLFFFVIIIFQSKGFSSNYTVIVATNEKGLQLSSNNGKSWKSFNDGLPESFLPVRLYKYSDKLYLSTFSSGFFLYNNKNEKWENISSPDFKRRSIYDSKPAFRKISAFSVDPDDPNNMVLATKHSLYRSTDGGNVWKEIQLEGLNKRYYITSVAISGNKIYMGTSFNGLFESSGRGFKPVNSGLPSEPYSDTLKIPEQISSLLIYKTGLFTGFYFNGGIFYKDSKSNKFSQIPGNNETNIKNTVFDIRAINNNIFFSEGMKVFSYDGSKTFPVNSYNSIISNFTTRNDIICSLIYDNSDNIPPVTIKHPNPERKKRSINAQDRNALYISIPSLKNIDKYINYTKKSNINAFVIDMKDDFGNIYFTSKDKTASEIKAQKKPVEISKYLSKLKKNNIYSIARIVVFKDQKLWSAFNGRYAIKNKNSGLPWKGTESEYWVDPYSDFVHEYNINLAKDLETLGFDEIQFDYIRFPSDGAIQLCSYSYKKDYETYKSEILIDFLTRAKYSLRVPVSVDIYGFNSWFYFGNWIGQDIEELSHVVDVICPMVYPSHFGSKFYNRFDKNIRPYKIIRDGGIRGIELADRSVCLRPYLQAFNLLSPTWGPDYILSQINASKESGYSGYSLWNANGDYSVPYSAIRKD